MDVESEPALSQPSQDTEDTGSLYEPPLSPGCSSSGSSDTLGSLADLVEGAPADQSDNDDTAGGPHGDQ